MEEIDNELETKSIERDEVSIEVVDEGDFDKEPEPPVVPKKSKKVRSAAQIAAFEKAKIKRQENIRLKKEQKAQEKEDKKNLKLKFKEQLNSPKEARSKTPPLVRPKPSVQEKPIQSSNPREQVIQNHYYYYGVPPPQQETHYTKSDKKKKKKKPIVESSSSEEEEHPVFSPPSRAPSPADEPQSYKDLQNYQEPNPVPQTKPKPTLKFGYA